MNDPSDNTPALSGHAEEMNLGAKLGFLYLLGVPLCAGLATVERIDIGGINYTGLMWSLFFVAGVVLIFAEMARPGAQGIRVPVGLWPVWLGYLWLSLYWCEPLEPRNVQDAMQISMPLLVGVIGSLFVRTEDQLDRLLRIFTPTVLLLSVCPIAMYLGLINSLGLKALPRPLGLTAALAGGVFMARFPAQRLVPLLGWLFCILLTVATGSRMATVALLLIPVLHPLYRSRWTRIAAVLTIASLGIALFQTPMFQKRFFYEGKGTLTDVFEGDFLSFGRFETWPDIWDEAWRRPYLGAGVGSAYNFVPTVWENMHHVHNDYLRVGFELGLVGLVIFVSVLVWQTWHIHVQIKRSKGIVTTAFAAAWLGFLVLMITSCTDNTLSYNLWYTNPLFAVLGAAYGVAGRTGASSQGLVMNLQPDRGAPLAA